MHLADAFIQSDLQCIQAIQFSVPHVLINIFPEIYICHTDVYCNNECQIGY